MPQTRSQIQTSPREKLLQAAGPIFAEKGFEGATVREICEAAEANLAAVNYHFGDKSTLYLETVRHASQRRHEQVPLPERETDADPELLLHDIVQTLARRMLGSHDDPWEPRLMMREVLEPTEACEHLVNEYFRPFFTRLTQVIATIAGRSDPEILTRMAFSIVGQCMHYRVAGQVMQKLVGAGSDNFFEADAIAEHVYQFSLAAIRGYKQT